MTTALNTTCTLFFFELSSRVQNSKISRFQVFKFSSLQAYKFTSSPTLGSRFWGHSPRLCETDRCQSGCITNVCWYLHINKKYIKSNILRTHIKLTLVTGIVPQKRQTRAMWTRKSNRTVTSEDTVPFMRLVVCTPSPLMARV